MIFWGRPVLIFPVEERQERVTRHNSSAIRLHVGIRAMKNVWIREGGEYNDVIVDDSYLAVYIQQ